jgi:cleavage stimulation factor subunit 3
MGDNIIDEYHARLCEAPYDLELWAAALKEAQNRPVERVRELYDLMVSYFPTSGKFWKVYIEHEVTLT